MYIHGLIPQNYAELAEAVPIGGCLCVCACNKQMLVVTFEQLDLELRYCIQKTQMENCFSFFLCE